MQFIRVEVPSLGHHMVYPRLSHPLYELERTISLSNLTILYTSTEMKKKILRKFTNEYFKYLLQKAEATLASLISEYYKKTGIQNFV